VACRFTLPSAEPITVTEQLPPVGREQVLPEGKVTLPLPPVCDSLTVPVGVLPVTFAVHTLAEPELNETGLQDRDVALAGTWNSRTLLLLKSATQRLPGWSKAMLLGPFMPVEVVAAAVETKSG